MGRGDMTQMSRDDLPDRRVVLLGASNIARGMSIVFDSAQSAWGSPLDIIAATGHGRSYGMSSRVLGRTLPGILQSGLWDDLATRPPAPTAALLTDIGNDILYGASAELITNWVEQCLSQLQPQTERITVTQLPLASLERLGKMRFVALRSVLFPRSRLTLDQAITTARGLNENISKLAKKYDATVIDPVQQWYGIDPIHIKRRHQSIAWQQIFQSWIPEQHLTPAEQSILRWARLRRIKPQSRHMFGYLQQQEQPARTLSDGSFVSLY